MVWKFKRFYRIFTDKLKNIPIVYVLTQEYQAER